MPRYFLLAVVVALAAGSAFSAGLGFDDYKQGIAELQLGSSTAAVELKLGSPYWRRVAEDRGKTKQEWSYPTSPREQTTLTFDAEDRLVSTTTKVWPLDVNVIHDESPIMSSRGRAKLEKLRSIRVGAHASELQRAWKPDAVLPYAQLVVLVDEVKRMDREAQGALLDATFTQRMDNLRGDIWMYRCGDVAVTFEVGAGERVVSVSEQLNPSKAQQKDLERSLNNRIW
jgi:hypothetical protein